MIKKAFSETGQKYTDARVENTELQNKLNALEDRYDSLSKKYLKEQQHSLDLWDKKDKLEAMGYKNYSIGNELAESGKNLATIGAGSIGAAGGALLGGGLGYGAARGLGLYGENSTTGKRMLGHLLTAGGAIGGGIGGYYGGSRLGAHYGNKWFDASGLKDPYKL